MMKRIIILFSVFAFLLPMALAETQIFSGSVITGQDKDVDGSIFRFTYDEASNKTFVQTPTQNLIVENGKCNSNGVFRVCVNSADYYDRNITSYVTYYKLDAAIYQLTGGLAAASTSTNYNLLKGEPANITITITNPTDLDVSSILYEENISNFTILNVNGCTLKGDKISWSGSLQSGYHKDCTAAVVAERAGAYNFAGSLRYFNGFETETKATDTLTINVLPDQLAVSQIADDNAEVEQPFYINVMLQNINPSEKMDVYVKINMPLNFALLNKPIGFGKNINILESNFRLEPGSSFNYSLYLKADAESKIPIKQEYDYSIKGLSYTMENDTFVKAPEPKPVINISAEYSQVTPGQDFIVTAKISNPSRIYELTGIKAKLTATYNNEIRQNLDKLGPNEAYTIISSTLTAPKSLAENPANPIELNLVADYDFNGISKSTNKTLLIQIKPGNFTGNATAILGTKNPIQAKMNETAAAASNLSNKTSKPAETIAEKPKSGFFSREILISGIVAITAFIALSLIINRIRKRKKENINPEKKALSEISEALDKPKNF